MPIKKIVFFSILIVSFFIINNLVHSIYMLWQKEQLVIEAKSEINKEKKEWESLKQRLETARKPQFVEEEARNKLLMAKPGEGVIVIPTIQASPSAKPVAKDIRPNWQKWWEVFF